MPKGARIAPNIHAVIRMWSGVVLEVMDLQTRNRIWKNAASKPPTHSALKKSMPPSVFATPRFWPGWTPIMPHT